MTHLTQLKEQARAKYLIEYPFDISIIPGAEAMTKSMPATELDHLIDTVHQATIVEVLRLIDKHDPNIGMNRNTSPAYWGNTLRAEITALNHSK